MAVTLNALSELNHSDPDSLLAQENCIHPHSYGLLCTTEDRIPHNSMFQARNYRRQASIIAMSTWEERHRFCHCGIRQKDGKSGHCMQKMMCRLCNHVHRRVPFESLLIPHFGEDTWFFFTLSYKRAAKIESFYSANFAGEWPEASGPTEINDLNSFDLDGGFYVHEIHEHLEAGASGLKLLSKKRMLTSALLVYELAFKFLPLQVLPHCHGVICSRESGEYLAEVLAEAMATYLYRAQDLNIRLMPSVQVYKLKTPDDFLRTIRYSIKSIDLVSPYETAYVEAEKKNRVFELNRHVDEALTAFAEVTGGLRKIRTFGKLNGRYGEAYCR